jgi:hypothetical protein
MANTLITPSVIAKEAVMALENNLVMANLVHRDFSAEFQKVGATVTVRKPATFTATAFSTTVAAQNIAESSVQVVLDKHYDITAEITSQQLSLDIADFSQQVLQPMMREHAQKVDYNILSTVYSSIAGHTAVSGTHTLGDLANLMVQLDIQKVPVTERRAVLTRVKADSNYIFNILNKVQPAATHIYISDNEYWLCSKEDIAQFLMQDWTNKKDYVKEEYDCDDFSYRLTGQFSVKDWSGIALGIVWTDLHALNCLIDNTGKFYFIEPQSDKLQENLEAWQGNEILFILM